MGDPLHHPWTTGLLFGHRAEAALWVEWIEENPADRAPVKVGALVSDEEVGRTYEAAFRRFAEASDVVGELVVERHERFGSDS